MRCWDMVVQSWPLLAQFCRVWKLYLPFGYSPPILTWKPHFLVMGRDYYTIPKNLGDFCWNFHPFRIFGHFMTTKMKTITIFDHKIARKSDNKNFSKIFPIQVFLHPKLETIQNECNFQTPKFGIFLHKSAKSRV